MEGQCFEIIPLEGNPSLAQSKSKDRQSGLSLQSQSYLKIDLFFVGTKSW